METASATLGQRILFAPHEINGQMSLLARGMRDLGHDAVAVSYTIPRNGRPPEQVIGHGNSVRARASRVAFAARAMTSFDIFHFFYGTSLLPRFLDLKLLRLRDKQIVVHFRGSDIRSRRWLTSGSVSSSRPPIQEAWQRKSLAVWRRAADLLLVATPDLLDIVPEAVWIGQAFDLATWDTPVHETRRNGGTLRLVHTPSAPAIKGTEHVIRAVENLKRRGARVELALLQGRPYTEIRAALAQADAAVDQLYLGWYANAAIEMMATGLPVISYIDRDLRAEHAPELPIISASPKTIEQSIESLLEMSVPERRALGDRGRAYVRSRHDVHAQCARLLELYRNL